MSIRGQVVKFISEFFTAAFIPILMKSDSEMEA